MAKHPAKELKSVKRFGEDPGVDAAVMELGRGFLEYLHTHGWSMHDFPVSAFHGYEAELEAKAQRQ